MSSFQCDKCGMINIDCGKDGFKTPRELELEEENKLLKSQLDVALASLVLIRDASRDLYGNRRVTQTLQKIKQIGEQFEIKQCEKYKHYYTDYYCLHGYCDINDEEVFNSCDKWESEEVLFQGKWIKI